MNILEKDLEDLIWDAIKNKDFECLRERGLNLNINSKFYRQLNLHSYGIPDIVAIRSLTTHFEHDLSNLDLYIDIYELKKDVIDISAFNQIVKYARGFQRLFNDTNGSVIEDYDTDVHLTLNLIGTRVNKNCNSVYLGDIFDDVNLYTMELDFHKGVIFKKEENYSQVEEKLPTINSLNLLETLGYE